MRTSTGYSSSDLAKEREKVLEYYNAKLPKPQRCQQPYVSQDVYNAVQSMQAALLETFAAGNRIVKFAPQGPDDVAKAAVASSFVDYVMFRQNDGYSIFRRLFQMAFWLASVSPKSFGRSREIDEQEFSDLTQDELDMVLAEDEIELLDSDTDAVVYPVLSASPETPARLSSSQSRPRNFL